MLNGGVERTVGSAERPPNQGSSGFLKCYPHWESVTLECMSSSYANSPPLSSCLGLSTDNSCISPFAGNSSFSPSVSISGFPLSAGSSYFAPPSSSGSSEFELFGRAERVGFLDFHHCRTPNMITAGMRSAGMARPMASPGPNPGSPVAVTAGAGELYCMKAGEDVERSDVMKFDARGGDGANVVGGVAMENGVTVDI